MGDLTDVELVCFDDHIENRGRFGPIAETSSTAARKSVSFE
jgi:hypothetical protein